MSSLAEAFASIGEGRPGLHLRWQSGLSEAFRGGAGLVGLDPPSVPRSSRRLFGSPGLPDLPTIDPTSAARAMWPHLFESDTPGA